MRGRRADGDDEVAEKLLAVRHCLEGAGLAAVRLRGVDWFAWATAGGSSAVLLAAEVGVAEVLVTRDGAWVLTDAIEGDRLADEQVPSPLEVWAGPWAEPERREAFVATVVGTGTVGSDRPEGGEVDLPDRLRAVRWSLGDEELGRLASLGRDAAEAATDALAAAEPAWTGHDLAAAAGAALRRRGIEPALVLVGDERRLATRRHPTATADPLGSVAMLVVCGRRHGLYANLSRFVAFRPLSAAERSARSVVLEVEAAAFAASTPGATIGSVFGAITDAYRRAGHGGAERSHHQGGPCGYRSRDLLATYARTEVVEERNALAWNPSLPGMKVEDTVVSSTAGGIDVLTVDPRWPTVPGTAPARPDVWVRT